MNRTLAILSIFIILLVGCDKDPIEDPPIPITPDDDTTEIITPKKVNLHQKFTENFSNDSSDFFAFNVRTTRDDFRYYSGVPSLSARNTDILMLRIDPADPAGSGRGAQILSTDYTFYGTYSARIRVPDIRTAQSNVGAVIGFSAYDVDSDFGLGEIGFEWRIANPQYVYIGTYTGNEEEPNVVTKTINLSDGIIDGYDASARFYTYGFDWYPDHISWWILHPTTKEKIILWNYEGTESFSDKLVPNGIPVIPVRFKLNFWHSKIKPAESIPTSIEAPLYPYEMEADWISYEPFDELIKVWYEQHFSN